MKTLKTFDDVLEVWEKPKALSDDLGVPFVNAQAMKARKSIAVDHWPKLIELLKARGYSLTTDDLARMWKQAREQRALAKQGEAA